MALLVGCAPLHAALCTDTTFSVTLGSVHQKDKDFPETYNERNLGIGAECGGLEGGVFYNSIKNLSPYIGGRYGTWAGIRYGVVLGYDYPVVPYVVAYIQPVSYIELTLIPATRYNPATLAYSLRF